MRPCKEPTFPTEMRRTPFLPALWLAMAASVCAQAATTYFQDFNSYPDGTTQLGDGSLLSFIDSNARIQGGALLLLEDGSEEGITTFRVAGLNGAANGWSASFKANVSSSDIAADGFSFSWGSEIGMFDETGGSENGWGVEVNHLHFAIDFLDNGDESSWGLTLGGAHGFNEYVFANVPGEIVEDGGSVSGEVFVRWDPVEGASFRTTGFRTNIDVTGIATPGIAVADSNTFAISARNGGFTSTVVIDDLRIASVPEPGSVSLGILSVLLAAMHRRRRA